MPEIQLLVQLEEDNNIERHVEIDTKTTFEELHQSILLSMMWDIKNKGTFYASNKLWKKQRAVSTAVKKNIKDAEFLSARKTAVSALIQSPDQRFIYEYHSPKKVWNFQIYMKSINDNSQSMLSYPNISHSQGLPPHEKHPDVLKNSEGTPDLNLDMRGGR